MGWFLVLMFARGKMAYLSLVQLYVCTVGFGKLGPEAAGLPHPRDQSPLGSFSFKKKTYIHSSMSLATVHL